MYDCDRCALRFIFFPNTPETTKAFYFTEEDKRKARERLVEDDREPRGEFSWDMFRRAGDLAALCADDSLDVLEYDGGKVSNTVVWVLDE